MSGVRHRSSRASGTDPRANEQQPGDRHAAAGIPAAAHAAPKATPAAAQPVRGRRGITTRP